MTLWSGRRALRLVTCEVTYNLAPCISGLRIFGGGNGAFPEKAVFTAVRQENGIDMDVTAAAEGTLGYNILFGADCVSQDTRASANAIA